MNLKGATIVEYSIQRSSSSILIDRVSNLRMLRGMSASRMYIVHYRHPTTYVISNGRELLRQLLNHPRYIAIFIADEKRNIAERCSILLAETY